MVNGCARNNQMVIAARAAVHMPATPASLSTVSCACFIGSTFRSQVDDTAAGEAEVPGFGERRETPGEWRAALGAWFEDPAAQLPAR